MKGYGGSLFVCASQSANTTALDHTLLFLGYGLFNNIVIIF